MPVRFYIRNTVLFRISGAVVHFQRVDGDWRRSERYATAADLIGDGRAVEVGADGRLPRKRLGAVKAVPCGK